nr:hypothetical protein HK105_005686 [Polyrhizophydium stewartii]
MLVEDIDFPTDLYSPRDGRLLDCFENLVAFAPHVFEQHLPADARQPAANMLTMQEVEQVEGGSEQQQQQLTQALRDATVTAFEPAGAAVATVAGAQPATWTATATTTTVTTTTPTSVQSSTTTTRAVEVHPPRRPGTRPYKEDGSHSDGGAGPSGLGYSILRSLVELTGNMASIAASNELRRRRGGSTTVVVVNTAAPAPRSSRGSSSISSRRRAAGVVVEDPRSEGAGSWGWWGSSPRPEVVIPANQPSPRVAEHDIGADDESDGSDAGSAAARRRRAKGKGKAAEKAQPAASETKTSDDGSSGAVIAAAAVGAVVAGAASVLTLAAAYKASEHMGRADFLRRLEACLHECEQRLHRARLWIEERRLLQLDVPRLVSRDVALLEALVDCMHRLDTQDAERQMVPAYVGAGLSSSVILAGLLGFGSRHAGTIGKMGYAGLLLSGLYWAFLRGRFGSPVFKRSFAMVARKAQRCVEELGGLDDHAAEVRRVFDIREP